MTKNRNKNKRPGGRRNRRGRGRRMGGELAKQLYEADVQVMDLVVPILESADQAYDLDSTISASVDYTNLATSYGELKYVYVTFRYFPFFSESALSTDYANGAFGVRQGVFDVGVATRTLSQVIRLPGSKLIDNKSPWTFSTPIVNSKYFPAGMTNTIVSEVPKVNFYFGWFNNASTNTNKGMLHIKLSCKARSKIE
jgi:hypothetical protein